MSTIEVDTLLLEVEPGAPCGQDLEYDPAFLALEREAVGKPEVQYGDTITPAVPPDWKVVRRMAYELLQRSRDLRLAMHLVRANLALSGIAGLADALALVEGLLDRRWDSVHPMLDAEDGDDPTLRINSLAVLADSGSLVRELKEATLVVLPGLGPLTVKMIEIANGELPAPDDEQKIGLAPIEHALADMAPDALASATEALGRALDSAVNIEVILVRQVGSSQALNLDPLTRTLRKAHAFLARQQPADGALAVPDEASPAGAAIGAAPRVTGGEGGEIASRADVLRTLERVVQYYRQHEPSSPIPILLERAKRLVPMNFLELLQDLAPDGVAQMAVIRGPDGSAQESED